MTRSASGPSLGNARPAWHSRGRSGGLCFCVCKSAGIEDHNQESTTFVFGLGSEYARNWKVNLVCVATIIVNDRLQGVVSAHHPDTEIGFPSTPKKYAISQPCLEWGSRVELGSSQPSGYRRWACQPVRRQQVQILCP